MWLSTNELFKKLQGIPNIIVLDDEQKGKLQKCIKCITKDIFRVCEENNIHAMLYAGSVLGAIRHNGFIPWDDDIDICIYRKDYDKFVDKFKATFPEKYWIHTPRDTKNYGSIVTKIVLKGTNVRLLEDFDSDEYGAFVDVFVIENVFDNIILRKIQCLSTYMLKGIVSCKRIERDAKYLLPYFNKDKSARKRIEAKLLIGKLCCFFKLDTWVHICDKCTQMCKNDRSKDVYVPGVVVSPGGFLIERVIFGEGKKHRFEDEEWPIPVNAEQYLQMFYGDFMKVPPVEDREQHYYREFDFDF